MANPIDLIVGRNVREKRTRAGMGQEELGAAIGVTFQQVQKYERGLNRMGASRLVQIANAIGIPVIELFHGVSDVLPAAKSRPANDIRREQKMVDQYNQMPDEIQKAVSELVKALVIGLGQKFKGVQYDKSPSA